MEYKTEGLFIDILELQIMFVVKKNEKLSV